MSRAWLPRAWLLVLLSLPGFAAQAADAARLKVSIPVFDTGGSTNAPALAELGIFPRIREIEAQFLPYALRRQLTETGHWGAVRVVASDDVIEELVIHGDILQSSAHLLEIRIRATDATGAIWFDEAFSEVPDPKIEEPAYVRLFARVAARLDSAREAQSESLLASLNDTALLRYGARIAPKTFGQYIEETGDGHVQVRRLPAYNDPMLRRITQIREAEYVIIDQTDAQYEELFGDVDSIYDVWRAYNQKSLVYEAQDEQRISNSAPPGPKGSYEALLYAYDNYKYSRLTAEERDDMAVGFDNEVRPIVRRLDERLADYDEWREIKYMEWNRLLEELNEIETRLSN